ncbi:hypothetical protein TESG_02644 [Trichophyton tonsurans CBS 112818]|uniref:Uncharacterized protein n=1 Tax=Trichophyton tonsurans (strain CBS 112818) TaxID=647933 RepID=F2RUT7_TRIT1|nr:hypothetical protein TESG_02644 [Trichophyton tonsurans CBS 112818]
MAPPMPGWQTMDPRESIKRSGLDVGVPWLAVRHRPSLIASRLGGLERETEARSRDGIGRARAKEGGWGRGGKNEKEEQEKEEEEEEGEGGGIENPALDEL